MKKSNTIRNMYILEILIFLMRKSKKHYCFPTQKKILEILKKRWGICVSRRTLNRYLGCLEREGMIKRVRRHKKGEDGKIKFGSTLYFVLQRGFRFLSRVGEVFRSIGWVWRRKKEGALKKDVVGVQGGEKMIGREELSRRMKGLIAGLFGGGGKGRRISPCGAQ